MSAPPTVISGRWACVTAGEYDHRVRRVIVNEAVVDAVARAGGHAPELVRAAIVAHEVAHATAPRGIARDADECRARAAAIAAAGRAVVEAVDEVLRTEWHADCSRS